jgi:hypothetical protein
MRDLPQGLLHVFSEEGVVAPKRPLQDGANELCQMHRLQTTTGAQGDDVVGTDDVIEREIARRAKAAAARRPVGLLGGQAGLDAVAER